MLLPSYLMLTLLAFSPFASSENPTDVLRENSKHISARRKKNSSIHSLAKEGAIPSDSRSLQSMELWRQMGQTIEGKNKKDYTGFGVSISRDGEVIAIGAGYFDGREGEDTGVVRAFYWDSVNEEWRKKGQDIQGPEEDNEFGEAVRLSGDGNILAIGGEDFKGGKGHVRVYEFDDVRLKWIRKGRDLEGTYYGDNAGWGLSLSNDGLTVGVGSYDNDQGGVDDGDENAGKTQIYRWSEEDDDWEQIGQDILGTFDENYEGWKLDLSFDGDIVAIGGPYFNGDLAYDTYGRVRVFKYNAGLNLWEPRGEPLIGANDGDEFGLDVSLSDSGDILAVASGCHYWCEDYYDNYAAVFQYNDGNWELLGNKITADTLGGFGFGSSVSISGDGSLLALHAFAPPPQVHGLAMVWELSGAEWVPFGQAIVIDEHDYDDSYATKPVALTKASVDRLIVGSPFGNGVNGKDSGYAKVYRFSSAQSDGPPAGCVDSKLAVFLRKNGAYKTCKWVARDPFFRCLLKVGEVAKFCPAACNYRTSTPGYELCLTSACEDPDGRIQMNNPRFPRDKPFTCAWVARKKDVRCRKKFVREVCRETCDNLMCATLGGLL